MIFQIHLVGGGIHTTTDGVFDDYRQLEDAITRSLPIACTRKVQYPWLSMRDAVKAFLEQEFPDGLPEEHEFHTVRANDERMGDLLRVLNAAPKSEVDYTLRTRPKMVSGVASFEGAIL